MGLQEFRKSGVSRVEACRGLEISGFWGGLGCALGFDLEVLRAFWHGNSLNPRASPKTSATNPQGVSGLGFHGGLNLCVYSAFPLSICHAAAVAVSEVAGASLFRILLARTIGLRLVND